MQKHDIYLYSAIALVLIISHQRRRLYLTQSIGGRPFTIGMATCGAFLRNCSLRFYERVLRSTLLNDSAFDKLFDL